MNRPEKFRPIRPGSPKFGIRHVFVHGLVVGMSIGVHAHEKEKPQRVRVSLDMSVLEDGPLITDQIADVVCYEEITHAVRKIVAQDHINLVETLAEKIADACLSDERITEITVRVEKLDVFPDAESVGVEICRTNRI